MPRTHLSRRALLAGASWSLLGCEDSPLAPAPPTETLYQGETAGSLHLDTAYLYWPRHTTGHEAIVRGPKEGGPTEELVPLGGAASLRLFCIDDSWVYFRSGSTVQRVSKTGGQPSTMGDLGDLNAMPRSGACQDEENLWVLLASREGDGKITRFSKKSGVSETIIQGGPPLTVGGGFLYFVSNGYIHRLSTTGGEPQSVTTIKGDYRHLAFHPEYLIATMLGPGMVRKISLAGEFGVLSGPHDDLGPIVLSKEQAYFSSAMERKLWTVNLDRRGARVIAAEQYLPNALVVDETHLYWTSSDGSVISRIALS